ncbi:MAG: polysaccharide pyruvyl transferase family protein [Adlercreutzia sp.]|nr:polysaccharide pyruvyl transferase family protein [Adlercreutzia sp.]
MITPKASDGIYRILLLTNRDSDNGGDQVIEACAKALIQTAMTNMGIDNYKILSRAAGIIPIKYVETRDEALLENARKAIKEADVLVFGGAPLFNYRYQIFYERTATTLELAEEYHTPVIFSSIGVEGYDEDNEKCQRLKSTLNLDCVKQITTRDDFDSLQKFIESDQVVIDKVSDPAVFTGKVFEKFVQPKAGNRIGVFIMRANAFVDNKIKFNREQAAQLWLDLIDKLEERGYDYELLTSGHFGDEAFLDKLIQEYGVNPNKCVFNMNSPEKLIAKISSYDGVISCRLHPSIISYALNVPSLGIVWNSKVNYFYDAIGYPERIIPTQDISGTLLLDKLEEAMREGVHHDDAYLASVYDALFSALQKVFVNDSSASMAPFSFSELWEAIPPFQGTSDAEKEEKIKRKFRRTYKKYNSVSETNRQLKKEIKALKKRIDALEHRPTLMRRGKNYVKRKARAAKKKLVR